MDYITKVAEKKSCTKCFLELPATTENFVKAKKGKFGLSSVCKPCQLKYRLSKRDEKIAYDKRYAEENKERKQEYYSEYYQENREKKMKYSKEYYQENKEAVLEYCKNRYNDADYVKYKRKYRQSRRSRDNQLSRAWRLKNREKVSGIKQARYNKKKGLDHNLTHEQWLAIVSDFDLKCAYCERSEPLTRDHFIPISKDGEFTKNNIIPACRSCNSSKNDKDFFVWYPTYDYYSKRREQKILSYLNYNSNKVQQLALI